jgi:hypothetical protein
MSDNPTRKGTREKKPPKHFDFVRLSPRRTLISETTPLPVPLTRGYSLPHAGPAQSRPRKQPARQTPLPLSAELQPKYLPCHLEYRDSHQPNLPDRNRPNENIPDNEPKKEQTHKRAELRSAQRDNESAGPQKRGK